MTWWLRAHRSGWLAVSVVAFGALAWGATGDGPLATVVPSPIRAGAGVPLALWLPLTMVGSLCWACSVDENRGPRTVAVRSNDRLLAGLVSATVAVALVALVPAASVDPLLAAAIARNVVGLTALAFVLRRPIGGAAATALVSAFVVLAALLGAGADGSAAWWAFPVADHPSLDDLVPAALIVIGSCRALLGARPAAPG